MSAATTTRYERCPDCTDGSCGSCGPKSNEHAAPGIRLVVRQVRFVPCLCGTGCDLCGPVAHELAALGVTVEVIEEHGAKRWMPSVHLDKNGKSACGTGWSGVQLTHDRSAVTCKRCLRWNG
jgi:hypothetical protein